RLVGRGGRLHASSGPRDGDRRPCRGEPGDVPNVSRDSAGAILRTARGRKRDRLSTGRWSSAPARATPSLAGGRSDSVATGLVYASYRSWCGNHLVMTAGFDRDATTHKWLVTS